MVGAPPRQVGRKKKRTEEMRKWLMSKNQLSLPRLRCEALLELKLGLTRRRIREYLQTIADAGFIDISDSVIDLSNEIKGLPSNES